MSATNVRRRHGAEARRSAHAMTRRATRRAARSMLVEALEARQLLSGNVFISEFMADNSTTLLDKDGAASDWIELHNPTASAVNLNGYFLTDKKSQLNQWAIPNVSIAANGYMVIFASGKNLAVAGQELHTNFSLAKTGEYLALTAPNGTTVLSSFDPNFPGQSTDISYGTPVTTTNLISTSASTHIKVPTTSADELIFMTPGFNDGGWTLGTTGVGFGSAYAGLLGTNIQSSMLNVNASAYMRIPFNVADPSAFDALTLRMRYNDGFVAYLNGVEVARRNAPATPHYNSAATATGPTGTGTPEDIDISVQASLLQAGNNVLAIQGLNLSAANSTFIISPELLGYKTFGNAPAVLGGPTPNAINLSSILGTVADTKFDHDRGFYTSPFDVAITSDTPGASIRYTTNGIAPTTTTGTLYTGPIHVTSTTSIRAIAYKTGYRATDVDTQSYIFLNDVIHQPAGIAGFPTSSYDVGNGFTAPQDTAMDQSIVNSPTYSAALMAGLTSIPTMSIVANITDIWGSNGFMDGAQDRPASIELIDPANALNDFQINAGAGLHSHDRLKQSIGLTFKSTFGASKLQTNLLQNGPLNGDSATDSFDHLVLRAGNNRAWSRAWNPDATTFTEDEWYRASDIALTGEGAHGNYVHLYLNGVYWGLYNTVEKPDDSWDASYYGGDKDGYFAISHDGPDSGNATRWNYLTGPLLAKPMSVAANYDELKQYLDVTDFSDYLLLAWYQATTDWPSNNWWAGNRNDVPGPAHFQEWDGEWSWDRARYGDAVNGAWVSPAFAPSSNDPSTIPQLWRAAWASPDFKMLFADRVYRALNNNGALTDQNSIARFDTLNNYISNAVVAESARWGDSLSTLGQPTRTRNVDWQNEVTKLRNIMNGNGARFITALRNANYYPSINPPTLSQQGGTIPVNYSLTMINPNGAGIMYYTTDGSDPRLPGGGLNPNAHAYSGGITLATNTLLNVRVLNGTTWSAVNVANFVTSAALAVRVTEINYHPEDPPTGSPYTADDFEFIEIRNTSATSVDVTGFKLSVGVSFTFPSMTLAAGANVVVVANSAAFQARYGTGPTIAGTFTGSLSNAGEQIVLSTAPGATILDFTYTDTWYPTTDGDGRALVINNPTAAPATWGDSTSWHASGNIGGSPGATEISLSVGAVVINELLANTAGAGGDWIELRNTTGSPIDLSNWLLSDSDTPLLKYRIPLGTTIAANGLLTFTSGSSFGSSLNAGVITPFDFTRFGGHAYLSSGDAAGRLTGYGDDEDFGASDPEISFGRYVNSVGDVHFPSLTSPTFGLANAGLSVGPVVINEIDYNPGGTRPEFIELRNTSGSTVNLFDPANPSNTWKLTDGIDFTFPAASSMPAGGYVLVVPIDPTVFRNTYRIPAGMQVFGPYTGSLDNVGEKVQLSKPGVPQGGTVPYIAVDRIHFSNLAPWPTAPNGTGPSLSRVNGTVFGNDPINWTASPDFGTPGYSNTTTNSAPTVSAGGNQSVSTGAATLAGSAGDDALPYGNPLTIAWTKVSGPGTVTFVDATNPGTAAQFSIAGTYVLKLTVSDGAASNFATMQIITGSGATNQPPTVSAGSNQTITLPASANLAGTASDDGLPTGSTLTTTWTKFSGPGTVTFGNANLLSTTASFSIDGTYVLRLTASDGTFSPTSDVTITVNPATTAPTVASLVLINTDTQLPVPGITLSPTGNNNLNLATLPAHISLQANTNPVTVGSVRFGYDATSNFRTENGAPYFFNGDYVPYTFTVGTHSVAVTAFDATNGTGNTGGTLTFTLVFTNSSNQAPTVNAGSDQAITLPASANLVGAASDDGLPSGTLATIWSKLSGPGAVAFGNSNLLSTTASFTLSGSYVLRLTASDGTLSNTSDVTITVNPPAVTGVTATTANGLYGLGATVNVTVGFTGGVVVTGTPRLALNSGGFANYSTGSGTNTLVFTYTVGAGDTAADLDYLATTSLTLNGGTIKDAATNFATLTLPAPGSAGSLGASKNIVIDSTPPTAIYNGELPTRGAATLDFTITYADANGIDTVTFDNNDITVTAPGGYTANATFISAVGGVAKYRISAPGGSWDQTDNATYTITQNAGQVNDSAANSRPAGTIGSMVVNLAFAWMTGSTLNVEFDGTTTPITLATSGSNVTATKNGTTLSFGSVTGIVALGTGNDDVLQVTCPLAPPVTFNNGNGHDLLHVLGGTMTLGSDLSPSLANVDLTVDVGASVLFDSTQHLRRVTINGTAAGDANGIILVVQELNVAGTLDLKQGNLIVDYSSVSPLGTWTGSDYDGVTGLVRSGRHGGDWAGPGIISSSAGGVTSLAVADASALFGISGAQTHLFGSESVDATAIIVKYTYGGDSNLDGKLNVDDYTRIDFNVPLASTGWYNGDFNLDGKINVDDYTIIDFNVGIQGLPL